MRSYETARTIFSILEFVGWAVVVLGFVAASVLAIRVVQYAGSEAAFFAMVPGIAASVVGLFAVASVQSGRANVDAAEYSQQSLKIAR